MPKFPDAVGYLLELRDAINQAWFHVVCDKAIASGGQQLSDADLEHIWDCFHGNAQYNPTVASPVAQEPNTAAVAPAYVESLSNFNGFKKLSTGLEIIFDKQVTIIFGNNASGKSSLCQALKVLASPNRPTEPLHNVHTTQRNPSFSYKFQTNVSDSNWNETAGFGLQAHAIKYFDSTIAIKHIEGTIQPKTAVEISAFYLEIFNNVRVFIRQFQTYARSRINRTHSSIQTNIYNVKQQLAPTVNINSPPFDNWSATNSANVLSYINSLQEYGEVEQKRLDDLIRQLQQLTTASSEEGLQSLRAQYTLLEQLETSLLSLSVWCKSVSLKDLQATENAALIKRSAVATLANSVFPIGSQREYYHALITAAESVCNLSELKASEHSCPLCKQVLGEEAESLFKQYHEYITSNLQTEITELEEALFAGRVLINNIKQFQLGDFSACRNLLPDRCLDSIILLQCALTDAVPAEDQTVGSADVTTFARFTELATHIDVIRTSKMTLNGSINTGTQSRQELVARISEVNTQIANLKAYQAVWMAKDKITQICNDSAILMPDYNRVHGYEFTNLLRSMTIKGKEAHEELVLSTFEQRLNEEYIRLCGKSLEEMGVRLSSRGEDQDIIVTSHIGEQQINRVLSEGEQKVHALAIFFCEAIITPQRILVFDDPANSFDFNYISNFCERIRDLVQDQPNTQVIIFTHNWDFFMNLQFTINRSRLDSRMSVQVLEDCSTIIEYTERWEQLCTDITALLSGPEEPNLIEKQNISGFMRRLIECLTNKFVFNDQRHQYKNKTLPASDFHSFTKLVPLNENEAGRLRDLYANLSPPEHDDPRNFYTTKSKAQFQAWFGEVQAMKVTLEARRPR